MTLIKFLIACVGIAWAMCMFYTLFLFLTDTNVTNSLLFGGFLMIPHVLTSAALREK